MGGYWLRHRLIPSSIASIIIAVLSSALFVFPTVVNKAWIYNDQSIYKNSKFDFVVPEPSYDQVMSIPGTEGIDKVFPFYLTKTSVDINGETRTTTVLLSDQFENIDITMYNDKRLIDKLEASVEHPILVDWRFCKDTSARVGDTVSFSLNGTKTDFIIQAIYETNTIYDGGAILAHMSEAQKNAIVENAVNNGYTAMYVSAKDYPTCKHYLTDEYRPLGRLRNRNQFDSDEQYNVHYNAIMASGYANEITDLRTRVSEVKSHYELISPVFGAALAIVLIIAFNAFMATRGCENGYFAKHCIPKGIKVYPYYSTTFVYELVCCVVLYTGAFALQMKLSKEYIPNDVFGITVVLIPIAVVIAEIIALLMNRSKVSIIQINYKLAEDARRDAEEEKRLRS